MPVRYDDGEPALDGDVVMVTTDQEQTWWLTDNFELQATGGSYLATVVAVGRKWLRVRALGAPMTVWEQRVSPDDCLLLPMSREQRSADTDDES